MPPVTLAWLLREAKQRLANAGVDDPALEARLIVEHFSDTTQTQAITHPGCEVESATAEQVMAAVDRRITGMPVHRILGHRGFYGLKLTLSPGTLEPRPDTETLVDLALPEARRIAAAKGTCRILDLGTGSGAIALALLSAVPQAKAVGTDISADALETANRNADMNGVAERFVALRSDWFESVDGQFDLIVSNPPYIPTAELETLPREVREHDPKVALDGGPDGLSPYRVIAAEAYDRLTREGFVAVETGYDQKAAVAGIFTAEDYAVLKTARDLGRRDRALLFAPVRERTHAEKTLGKVAECR
ncbi:peptide chain release factor N(5)-glutamine methyltransferase [Chelativorans sp. AA-79]|uniref:peptide chain release factor N(5)-glutamine methyltransferase n=1 Tax=Chelativorans sp. AA-79 TaxID=3028735 RepID=UPI0023F7F24E|nr:peptide chain release factor N(5)-glutamine methyltransferase [Chelativorans sp. AA-79]WEX09005.1 peptide chain release factor N(5)-glutamine methyltransferase [Chelativorans sp. AA-79]